MENTCSLPVTRLAPSPTGLLHLGNAWAFLLAWLGARAQGGKVFLRMEDLDPTRSKPEFVAALVQDMAWLGLNWDNTPVYQSARGAFYQAALDSLLAQNLAYPCYCTRKELRDGYFQLQDAANAPHQPLWGDAGAAYPGTCRQLGPQERARHEARGRKPAWRLACPEGDFEFTDLVFGPQRLSLAQLGGDFALRRSDTVWAYQLAVSVDDAAMGVNLVVRGHDLLTSTPRQLLLFRLLGAPAPAYAHVPLLLDAQGERLAKRHGALALAHLRNQGVAPETIVGWLAAKAGFSTGPVTPAELAARLANRGGVPWHTLPAKDIRLEESPLSLWQFSG